MRPGDIVLFWLGGDPQFRGLYGWGRLISEAYSKPSWDSHGVDVICDSRFEHPILATQLRSTPLLRDMLILRAPQSTNFLLEAEEYSALRRLIAEHGLQTPPPMS